MSESKVGRRWQARIVGLITPLAVACAGGQQHTTAPASAPPAASSQAEQSSPPSSAPAAAPDGPPPSPATFSGGDGKSCDTAVVVHASDETSGVAAEYQWIREHFPGAKVTSQSLTQCKDRPADVLKFSSTQGDTEIWFDIGDYFGKM